MSTNRLSNRFEAMFSLLLGFSYIIVGIANFMRPERDVWGLYGADYYRALAQNPLPLKTESWALALGGVLGLAVVPVLLGLVNSENNVWLRWGSNIAYLGFATTALQYMRRAALVPFEASVYVKPEIDTTLQRIINWDNNHLPLDPQGWFIFGGVGLWVLLVSLGALRGGKVPKLWALVGIATTVMYWLVVASNVLEIPLLTVIAAGLGGIIFAPIWYIWAGLLFWHSVSDREYSYETSKKQVA